MEKQCNTNTNPLTRTKKQVQNTSKVTQVCINVYLDASVLSNITSLFLVGAKKPPKCTQGIIIMVTQARPDLKKDGEVK